TLPHHPSSLTLRRPPPSPRCPYTTLFRPRDACDALDGVADGVVSNPRACAAGFDAASLRCPGGTEAGNACLSDAQLGFEARGARSEEHTSELQSHLKLVSRPLLGTKKRRP